MRHELRVNHAGAFARADNLDLLAVCGEVARADLATSVGGEDGVGELVEVTAGLAER